MGQKENLERHAVESFCAEYNRRHRRKLVFVRLCLPRMPDTLCRLGDQEIGIEVAHTYGTGEEAAIRLRHRSYNDIPPERHLARRKMSLSCRAIGSLNQVLAAKGKKAYSLSPTWLLVRNAFVLWTLKDYRDSRQDICIPEEHPFAQVWFFCDGNGIAPAGIMRLA